MVPSTPQGVSACATTGLADFTGVDAFVAGTLVEQKVPATPAPDVAGTHHVFTGVLH
jgi:hypothetical protein